MATVHEYGDVRLWSFPELKGQFEWKGKNARVFGVAFSPDGQFFAAGSSEGVVRVWRVGTQEPVHEFRIAERVRDTFGVAFSPDSKRIAAGALKIVHVWELASGEETTAIEPAHGRDIASIVFTPDGKSIVSSGQSSYVTRMVDGKRVGVSKSQVRQWDADSGKLLRSFDAADPDERGCAIAISTDGKSLATLHDSRVRLWNIRTGTQVLDWAGGAFFRSHAVAFAPDGKRLATISQGTEVRVYATSDGARLLRSDAPQHMKSITCLDISADDKFVATGDMQGLVIVREIATGRVYASFKADHRMCGLRCVRFSPDGLTVDGSFRRHRLGVGHFQTSSLIDATACVPNVCRTKRSFDQELWVALR